MSRSRGRKPGKGKRRRPFDEKPFFCNDPAQMWLPVDWGELDEKGRRAAEAARVAQVPEMLALTTTKGNCHDKK